MEDFPVVTRESLAELDVLKREILASDFGSGEKNNMSLAHHALKKLAEQKEFEVSIEICTVKGISELLG